MPAVTKKKKVSRKGKMVPCSPECPSTSSHVAPVASAQPQPTTQTSPGGLPTRQETSELLEMRTRGNSDPELDAQATPMLDAIRGLVHTHTHRLSNVQKVVNNPLGKEVIKRKTDTYGEKEFPTEHLLREDLGERNKKVLKSARASDTVMNTSLAPKKMAEVDRLLSPHFCHEARMWLQREAGRLDQRRALLNRDQQACLPTKLLGSTG